VTLDQFSLAADRVGIRHRSAALLATSLVSDIERKKEGKKTGIIIDKSKIFRERKKTRSKLQGMNNEVVKIPAIYFDGKQDLTKVLEGDENDLSTDQQYLYKISHAVSSGVCPSSLGSMLPGHLHHARWVTLAARILRLYIATQRPRAALVQLATFVMRVYSPMWFIIRTKNTVTDGAVNLCKMIQATRYLPQKQRQIVEKVVQENAFYGHPEAILCAMLADDRNEVRALAATRIIEARRHRPDGIRKFVIPPLNFQAKTYEDLIDWDTAVITEPPLTFHLTDADFRKIKEGSLEPIQRLHEEFSLPNNTQSVERTVKEVTEASRQVYGHDARDGFIRARLLSRNKVPRTETKADFSGLT